MMFWSLKKKPSQVAQVEMPRPISFDSAGRPSSFAEAPVAMTTVCDSKVCSPAVTTNGCFEKSTAVASSGIISVPKWAACFCMVSISSGPWTPSTNPG